MDDKLANLLASLTETWCNDQSLLGVKVATSFAIDDGGSETLTIKLTIGD